VGETGEPFGVIVRASEEPESDALEELELDVVDFFDSDPGDVGPRPVGEGVVVEELVGEDQGAGEETEL
jgi:hypothetical protein